MNKHLVWFDSGDYRVPVPLNEGNIRGWQQPRIGYLGPSFGTPLLCSVSHLTNVNWNTHSIHSIDYKSNDVLHHWRVFLISEYARAYIRGFDIDHMSLPSIADAQRYLATAFIIDSFLYSLGKSLPYPFCAIPDIPERATQSFSKWVDAARDAVDVILGERLVSEIKLAPFYSPGDSLRICVVRPSPRIQTAIMTVSKDFLTQDTLGELAQYWTRRLSVGDLVEDNVYTGIILAIGESSNIE